MTFLERFSDRIIGVLNGFDRLVLRGRLRLLNGTSGMAYFLHKQGIRLTEFKEYVNSTTNALRKSIQEKIQAQGQQVVFLESPKQNKEEVAVAIAKEREITEGLITVLGSVELCKSYEISRNKKTKHIDLRKAIRKCLHYYFYMIHPEFGFMNARIQTWFPFDIQICLNGREWLSRKLDAAHIAYRRRDNCFTWLEDPIAAQKLMDSQLKLNWVKVLKQIGRQINPIHSRIFRQIPLEYYWTVHQSEWASDVMFRSAAHLAEIYPPLIDFAMNHFSCADVLRFLGKKVSPAFKGEIMGDFKDRPEGVRMKFFLDLNSVKLYDKAGSLLRPETTINNPKSLKVYRPKENDPNGEKHWLPMRKGIADLFRRAQYSQECNDRFLDSLAAVDLSTPTGKIFANLAKPTTWNGKRNRALNPWAGEDLLLLKAISRGEFKITGFKNSQLQQILFKSAPNSEKEKKQRSAKVSRMIRLLRAHHLIRKIPSTYRYMLTDKGTQISNALFAVQRLSLDKLLAA